MARQHRASEGGDSDVDIEDIVSEQKLKKLEEAHREEVQQLEEKHRDDMERLKEEHAKQMQAKEV